MVEPHIYCAACNQRRAYRPDSFNLLFRVLLNFAHNAQTCYPKSFYEWKTGSIEDRNFLTINYVIVLSSVLFEYGTVICINTIDNIL